MISKYIHFKPLSTGFQICIAKGILTRKQLKLLTLEFLYCFSFCYFQIIIIFFKSMFVQLSVFSLPVMLSGLISFQM